MARGCPVVACSMRDVMALLHCPLTLARACHLLAPASCPWQNCHGVPSLCSGPLLVLTLVQILVCSVFHFGVMGFAEPNGICPCGAVSHCAMHPPPSRYTPELGGGWHGWSGVIFPVGPLERVSLGCLGRAVRAGDTWLYTSASDGGHGVGDTWTYPPASVGGHLAVSPSPRSMKGMQGQPRWC